MSKTSLLRAVVLAASMATSCATVTPGAPDHPAGLDATVDAAWRAYGAPGGLPRVLVVQGAALSCTDPVSGKPGFPVLLVSGKGCREGYTVLPTETSVAWHGERWVDTSLVHELWHVAQARHGIFDPNHSGVSWYGDPASKHALSECPVVPGECGVVARTVDALRLLPP